MKNYYKILGVRKDASEDEIRARWIELTRHYHPDMREAEETDEKIKEINEAYQVLKYSSTRVEYDLKRAYDQRKRRYHLRRLSIPIGIFAALFIFGSIYLKKSQITIQAVMTPTDQRNQKDQRNQTDQRNQINDPNVLNVLNVPNQINQINPLTQRPNDAIDSNMQRRNDAKDLMTKRLKASSIQRPNDSMTQLPFDPSPFTFDLIIDSSTQQPNIQIDQTDQIDVPNDPNVTNDLNDPNDRNVLNVPLIATEEEVRQFFVNYTDRYIRKDLDGFLSLFSPKAVHNRQDGLEGIRKIYGNFLKQSQEIKYYMEDIRIEIYQNGVEVKARYELVQTLKKRGDKKIWKGDIRWMLVKENGALRILYLDYQPLKSH